MAPDDAAAEAFAPAAREALEAFPIEPDGIELKSHSENVTYRVVDRRDGAPYALRLHRPWYHTIDELISERDWIRALDGSGIAVQAPVATRDGREYASVTIPATGERRFAGLARWTTGRVLSEVLRTRGANLCKAKAGCPVPTMFPGLLRPPVPFTIVPPRVGGRP